MPGSERNLARVYVDAKIKGMHDEKLPKEAYVGYYVEETGEHNEERTNADESDDAKIQAVLFAFKATEKLSDGKNVLDFCNSFSPGYRRVVIVRHSERISFRNVPMEEWDGVGITEKGVAVARAFGRSLADDGDGSRLNVYGWGRRRCHETADAITEGAREKGRPVRRLEGLSMGGPISDYAAYKEWILSGRYLEMLETWQRAGDTKGGLTPIAEYSPHVFREILDPRISPPKEVSVIVTHDFHIFPLACHAFGTLVGIPDYLDGIVIGETEKGMRVGYRGSVRSTDLASLTR